MPVLLLYSSSRSSSEPWLADHVAVRGVGGVQVVRESILDGLFALWQDYLALVDVKRQVSDLRTENARLRLESRRLAALAAENARLREMLGFRDRARRHSHLLPTRVVGKSTSPFFRVVRIELDVGSRLVNVGQPVVTTYGVIGQVSRVFSSYADVQLVADSRSAVDVVVQRNRARGILKGLGSSDHYRCKIEYLLRTDEVAEGDVVVTSGMGGRYPKDLRIGVVSEVSRKQYGLYQQVEVTPSVDFSRLEEAFVVVDEPPSELEAAIPTPPVAATPGPEDASAPAIPDTAEVRPDAGPAEGGPRDAGPARPDARSKPGDARSDLGDARSVFRIAQPRDASTPTGDAADRVDGPLPIVGPAVAPSTVDSGPGGGG